MRHLTRTTFAPTRTNDWRRWTAWRVGLLGLGLALAVTAFPAAANAGTGVIDLATQATMRFDRR